MITGLELDLRETEEDFNKEKHRNHGKKTTLTLITHARIKNRDRELYILPQRTNCASYWYFVYDCKSPFRCGYVTGMVDGKKIPCATWNQLATKHIYIIVLLRPLHSTIHSYSYSALFYALYADHEEQTITISFENVQNWSHCGEKSTNIYNQYLGPQLHLMPRQCSYFMKLLLIWVHVIPLTRAWPQDR